MTLGWTLPSTTSQILMQRGPTIGIEIRHPPSVIAVLTKRNIPVPPPVKTAALIDTGATFSAIDVDLAKSLKLVQTGDAPTYSASGLNTHPVFAGALDFTGLKLGSFDSIPLIGVSMRDGAIRCLIGRDILANILMIYNGPQGQITLAR